jgi:hypothetical protein
MKCVPRITRYGRPSHRPKDRAKSIWDCLIKFYFDILVSAKERFWRGWPGTGKS